MTKPIRYALLALGILLLVLIRYFENSLFYDPYLQFFESDYLYIDSPRRETLKLTLFTTLRYVLNTAISIGILYVVFRDKNVVKFSVLLYSIAYLSLLILFLYFVINPKQEDYYLFFNVRRFLIQPLFVIILLPAFYYHKIRQ
mgnify:CR=1 FL=1